MRIFYQKGIYQKDLPMIPLINRGLMYGETIFTTMRSEHGKVFFIDDHFARLEQGCKFLVSETIFKSTNWPLFLGRIKNGLDALLREKGKGAFKYRVTCFVNTLDFKPSMDTGELDFFIYEDDLDFAFNLDETIRLMTKEKSVIYKDSSVNIKSGNYFNSFVAKRDALQKGQDDVLFLTPKSELLECTTSNIFFKKGDKICTPKICDSILDGITRKKLIECLKLNKIEVLEDVFTLSELYDADLIWVTSSLRGIQKVAAINSKEVSVNFDNYLIDLKSKLLEFVRG